MKGHWSRRASFGGVKTRMSMTARQNGMVPNERCGSRRMGYYETLAAHFSHRSALAHQLIAGEPGLGLGSRQQSTRLLPPKWKAPLWHVCGGWEFIGANAAEHPVRPISTARNPSSDSFRIAGSASRSSQYPNGPRNGGGKFRGSSIRRSDLREFKTRAAPRLNPPTKRVVENWLTPRG